ncbi:MAG: glycosyltransferase family 9 protein [Planctomycetota bacterium]
MSAPPNGPPGRLLVVIPNWVGDVVLATPVLAALRTGFAESHITYLLRSYVTEVVTGGGWHDEVVCWPGGRGLGREKEIVRLARRLRAGRFDLALLLTNSLRSALVVRMGGVPRRVGYARDGRGWLLTDRLRPLKQGGRFVPRPVLPYYAALAEHIGCPVPDRRLRLGITPEQEQAGRALLRHYELLVDGRQNGPAAAPAAGAHVARQSLAVRASATEDLEQGHARLRTRPYAAINVGAAFGAAKCWLPERFAEVCEQLHERHGLLPVLVGAGHEAPLMRHIARQVHGPVVCCAEPGTTLGSLKIVIREARLLVCNDTGPRHYGSAFNIPTVTIFGPTHQAWTDTDYAGEIKLQAQVPCGPCQLRACPLDLRCMQEVTTDMVMQAAAEVTSSKSRVISN